MLLMYLYQRGKHDITLPLLSEANDSFVAHDSRGFEAGQESELNKVDQFIKERSKMEPTRRIHAIWCVPDQHPILDSKPMRRL